MHYKTVRIIGVVLLVLGAAAILLQIMDGGKSVLMSIGAGGTPILIGGMLLGRSFRLENQEQAASDPPEAP